MKKMKKQEKNPTHVRFGQFLREKRLFSGVSQGKVAKSLGYHSPQFVSNWERGLAAPPMVMLVKIIDLLALDKQEVYDLLLSEREKELRIALQLEA